MSRAYILLSGGIDSTTCLAIAMRIHQRDVTGLSLYYGQRHEKEVHHAKRICHLFDVPFISKDIRGTIGVGGLTDKNIVIPHVSYSDLGHGVSPTYVPFRNGLLLSIAASQASADPEAVAIYYGAHAEDAENDAYPDCSVPFITAMGKAIDIGTYGQIELRAPLQFMTKAQVIQRGEELNVPWGETWSCYEGSDLHCGVCPTCRSRREGFIAAEVTDPTEYVK